MKNILIIDVGKEYGGAEKYVLELINSEKLKDYVFFVCVRKGSKFCKKIHELNITAEIIDFDMNKIVKSARMLKHVIENKHISLIHCNGINSLFIGSLIGKKISSIATVHGDAYMDRLDRPYFVRKLYAIVEIILLKNTNECIAVSNDLKQRLIKKGIDESKISVVYNGVDFSGFSVRGKQSKTVKTNDICRILSIGRLEPVKNFTLLVDSIKNLQENSSFSCECDIYGDGSEMQKLKDYIFLHKCDRYIRLKGFVPADEIPFDNYSLYIQPSKYETFGLSVIEAMSQGLPCIVSNIGGLKEIAETTGCLSFKNDSVKDLEIAIERFLSLDEDGVRKIVDQATKRLFMFTDDKMALEVGKIYERYV